MSRAGPDTEQSDRLDVGVNLAFIAPGRVGGSEAYLVRQLAGLGLVANDRFDLTLYVQPGFVDAHRDLVDRSNQPSAVSDVIPLPFDRDWRGARIALEHSWFARRARRHDIVHHGGGTAPLNTPRPAVVTIHDLQYLKFPEYFSRARLTYLHQMMPRTLRRADVVAVPSEFVRTTVIDAFPISPDSVVVVPHGVPEIARPDDDEIASARHSIGLPSGIPYLVYPAITHPHKRHVTAVKMMLELPDHRLVLLGGEGAAEPEVVAAIVAAGVSDRVLRPGRVPAAVRDALVAGADALVFPSAYEGFGAPLVEAMALDTPVVCSDQPAIREVVGDAAVIVSSEDPADWATGVHDAQVRRSEMIARGRARREAFTIDVSGAALADAYLLAARGRKRTGVSA